MVVTTPASVDESRIHQFMKQKSKWILTKIEYLKKVPVHDPKKSRQEFLKYKEQARRLVSQRIIELNKQYSFKYGRVSIKNQKSLWGSCSKKGNLNFNYKIVLLPSRHADYIIVHELCHLQEFNHSKHFWALVAQTIPEHKTIRQALKRAGMVEDKMPGND